MSGPPTTPARRGPKPTLSHEAVVEAALELIDADGLAALNMRSLAARLGVSAMTPYGYFPGKADLLDAMVDHALAALAPDPSSEAPWDERLHDAMRGMHDALLEHPGVIDLIAGQTEAERLDTFRQDLIAMLQAAGRTRRESTDALRTLTSYVLGYHLLTRLRGDDVGSFERGLEMLMAQIRTQTGGR